MECCIAPGEPGFVFYRLGVVLALGGGGGDVFVVSLRGILVFGEKAGTGRFYKNLPKIGLGLLQDRDFGVSSPPKCF